MTPPVAKALSTGLAVSNAALVRRFGTSVETPTGPIIDTGASARAHVCWI